MNNRRRLQCLRTILLLAALLLLAVCSARAGGETSLAPDEVRRMRALADFARKMKAANYPALFDKAAAEFNVPADILKGIAFAETRWEQLQWPSGETVSPETGMPRPYGIMSLWDNRYFGHSLIDAAALIGKPPDELKTDAFQNMRGAAALLRKLYDSTPKPADAPGDEIESWRKAIVKYCGIPQPELSEAHALDVYTYINQGYNNYGIEWDAHPVNLAPMRAEVQKIRADAQARTLAKSDPEGASSVHAPTNPYSPQALPDSAPISPLEHPARNNTATAGIAPGHEPTVADNLHQRYVIMAFVVLLFLIAAAYKGKSRSAVGREK